MNRERYLKVQNKEELEHHLQQYNKLIHVLNEYRENNPLENIDGVVNCVGACIREIEAIIKRDFSVLNEEMKEDSNQEVNSCKVDIETNLEAYEKFMKEHSDVEKILES